MKLPFFHIVYRTIRHYLPLPFLASGLPFIFASCTEDALDSGLSDSRKISFNVEEVASEEGTRAVSSSCFDPSLGILKLGDSSQNLFLVPYSEDAVLAKNKISRSETFTSENLQSFGVFAGFASDAGAGSIRRDYMDNVEVSRALGWMPEEEYLWPGDGSLHFNAYAPYYSNTENGSEGITSIENSEGSLTLHYTVPQDVTDQKDLLWASPLEASSSPCTISFNHSLVGIRFAAGAELASCTIKSISFSGLKSSGTLDLETGEWTNLSGLSSYSVDLNLTLQAAEGSTFVEAGSPITDDSETFYLLPQSLETDALLTVVMETEGKENVLTASLDGQKWIAGKTLTYRISANPASDSLILNVTGDFKTPYTGGALSFNVESRKYDSGNPSPVGWIAEFVDDAGNVISRPDWIKEFTASAGGDTVGSLRTDLQDMKFDAMSERTRQLQKAGNINRSSGFSPYNLASSSGGPVIENTANTYLIKAPGEYSIPLVYGNGIKNGTANSSAYTASTHQAVTLKNFTNHLGNALTSPYIFENKGCTPGSASLIWEDQLGLIRNVRLSEDGKSIVFEIPHNTIRQGNSIIAVYDSDGKVEWSWQIWITDTDLSASSSYQSVTVNSKGYAVMNDNLGYVEGGDVANFPETSVNIRFSQTGLPDGVEPLSKTVTLIQSGKTITTPDSAPFYQWGRKDPIVGNLAQWYDASHNEVTSLPVLNSTDYPTSELVTEFILNPAYFFTGSHTAGSEVAYPYKNLWNVNISSSPVKTIYDPSPVGYVVPRDQPFTFMGAYTTTGGENNNTNVTIEYIAEGTVSKHEGYYLTFMSDPSTTMFFPDTGYRASGSGACAEGTVGIWTSTANASGRNNPVTGGYFGISVDSGHALAHTVTDPLLHGFCIRPIKE